MHAKLREHFRERHCSDPQRSSEQQRDSLSLRVDAMRNCESEMLRSRSAPIKRTVGADL